MDIIPAIDLKNGKCVRLRQGEDTATTEYSTDPVAVARDWFEGGARRLHLVNLDGAFGRVIGSSGTAPADRGALIRYPGAVWWRDSGPWKPVRLALDAGAAKVVLGTVAVEDPPLFRRDGGAVRTGTDASLRWMQRAGRSPRGGGPT